MCIRDSTIIVDLTVAVEIGMVLAAILFIKRASETTQITAVDESTETEGSHHSLAGKEVPRGVMVFRIFGAFFFGAADKLDIANVQLELNNAAVTQLETGAQFQQAELALESALQRPDALMIAAITNPLEKQESPSPQPKPKK